MPYIPCPKWKHPKKSEYHDSVFINILLWSPVVMLAVFAILIIILGITN